MALIAREGFGFSTTLSDYSNIKNLSFYAYGGNWSISTGGPFGDNYLYNNGCYNFQFLWYTGGTLTAFQYGIRCALSTGSPTTSQTFSIYFYDYNGNEQFHLTINTFSGMISIIRNTTTLASSGPITIPINGTWFYLEVGAVISSSATGSVTIRVNNNTVLSVSNVITANTAATSSVSYIYWYGYNISGNSYTKFQHMYVTDTTGSAPNNGFLGDTRIFTGFPTAAGSSTQFTPSTTTNWQIAATMPPVTTKYNQDSNVGDTDLFTMTQVPTTAIIYAVTINTIAARTTPGARTMTSKLLSGSTTATGSSHIVSVAESLVSDTFATDPNTSAAWTVSAYNAIQAGYSIAS